MKNHLSKEEVDRRERIQTVMFRFDTLPPPQIDCVPCDQERKDKAEAKRKMRAAKRRLAA